IVYVDAERFFHLWRSNTLDGLCVSQECPKREKLVEDYKYAEADRCFKLGIDNPIPLANVGLEYGVGFNDGMTRTIWLIANGARSFPVFTSSKESAALLASELGATEEIISLPPNG